MVGPGSAPPASARRRLATLQRWRGGIVAIIFVTLLAFGWEGLVRADLWPQYLLPSPATVFARVLDGIRDNSIPLAIGSTMRRIAIGYSISVALGVSLGVAIARFRLLEQSLGTVINGLQALPSITWLPLALLWFGLNDTAIIFVVVMGSMLAIAQATRDGIHNVPPLYFRTARNLGASGMGMYGRVVLPAALPYIITGMKLGWSFAWRSLMAAELIFFAPGLGHLLEIGREFNDIAQVMAIMMVIVFLGLIVDKLGFSRLEQKVRTRWGLAGLSE